MKMRNYILILALAAALLPIKTFARDYEIPLGVPEPVTMTTTDMALGSYTMLLGSDEKCSKFYIKNVDASQAILVTYNSLTYTVVDDFYVLAAGAAVERDGQVPDGIYCAVTDTVGPVSVEVRFESWF